MISNNKDNQVTSHKWQKKSRVKTTSLGLKMILVEKRIHLDVWIHVIIKPSKCRNISIVKGRLVDWYDANLREANQVKQLREETIEGLKTIDKTLLPGNLKLWCLHFRPLTVCEVPITQAEKRGRTVSSFIKKWLGLPSSLSSIYLYNKGALELPLSGLTEEFKCAKAGLFQNPRTRLSRQLHQLRQQQEGSVFQVRQFSRQKLHSSMLTLLGMCSMDEGVLAQGQTGPFGTKQPFCSKGEY